MALRPSQAPHRKVVLPHMWMLRIALAIVFIWFGALKLVGESPVRGIIASMFPSIAPGPLLVALGVWECIIGGLFLLGIWPRLNFILFTVQMAGTFGLVVVRPELVFQDTENPLLLTTIGEFVVKNVVLLAAGWTVIANAVRRANLREAEAALRQARAKSHRRPAHSS